MSTTQSTARGNGHLRRKTIDTTRPRRDTSSRLLVMDSPLTSSAAAVAAEHSDVLDTHQKALQINLDNTKFGTFAEIGAGQEVARWFFRVGGAAGTIAKSVSAYDMTVSDTMYGATGRYVSRQRLETMLDSEFRQLAEHLGPKRGDTTRFFVFADTVAAKSYTRKDNCHGWMGIRFQTQPGAAPSQIILHVSLLDREAILQQEATGILGVNLIHSALYE